LATQCVHKKHVEAIFRLKSKKKNTEYTLFYSLFSTSMFNLQIFLNNDAKQLLPITIHFQSIIQHTFGEVICNLSYDRSLKKDLKVH